MPKRNNYSNKRGNMSASWTLGDTNPFDTFYPDEMPLKRPNQTELIKFLTKDEVREMLKNAHA